MELSGGRRKRLDASPHFVACSGSVRGSTILTKSGKLDSYKLYIGSAFLYQFCWALMTTVSMVFMVTVAGLDPLQMVLVGTVLELSVFLFEIPTGIIADVFSRRLSIIIGYMVIGMGYLLLGLFPRFDIILLSQVIWGIGSTFISGANQAWISDEIGEKRANRSFIVASQSPRICEIRLVASCMSFSLCVSLLCGSLSAFGPSQRSYQARSAP